MFTLFQHIQAVPDLCLNWTRGGLWSSSYWITENQHNLALWTIKLKLLFLPFKKKCFGHVSLYWSVCPTLGYMNLLLGEHKNAVIKQKHEHYIYNCTRCGLSLCQLSRDRSADTDRGLVLIGDKRWLTCDCSVVRMGHTEAKHQVNYPAANTGCMSVCVLSLV